MLGLREENPVWLLLSWRWRGGGGPAANTQMTSQARIQTSEKGQGKATDGEREDPSV